MRTINKIITDVNCRYGAPMGRMSIGVNPNLLCNTDKISLNPVKVYDCAVPMTSCGAYDKGGVYWGIGRQLRVRYTKDLSYIEFYRLGD